MRRGFIAVHALHCTQIDRAYGSTAIMITLIDCGLRNRHSGCDAGLVRIRCLSKQLQGYQRNTEYAEEQFFDQDRATNPCELYKAGNFEATIYPLQFSLSSRSRKYILLIIKVI